MSDTPDHDSSLPAETEQDAQRRKFREALDRKKMGHHGEGMASANPSQQPHTGPAKAQRQFRRKSGG